MFTVTPSAPTRPVTAGWSRTEESPAAGAAAPLKSRPGSGDSEASSSRQSPAPPPPYTKLAVYDPNSADELRDWDDRNN